MLTFSEICVDIYATENTGTFFWPQILFLRLVLDANNKNQQKKVFGERFGTFWRVKMLKIL